MPGYDKSRIVDWDEENLEEFVCGICQDIFVEPVFVRCCRQTYCRQCITEWLTNRNTCPNDRSSLTIADIIEAPRSMSNLISNMRIKCEYFERGCTEVLKVSSLQAHLDKCQYRICEECMFPLNDKDHNCLNNLKNIIQQLKEENEKLKLFKYKANEEMSKQSDSIVQLTQEMEKVKVNSNKKLDKVILESKTSRFHYGKLYEIPFKLKKKLTECCEYALANYNESMKSNDLVNDLTKAIEEIPSKIRLDKEWQIIIYVNDGFCQYNLAYHHYFSIIFSKLVIIIYMKEENCQHKSIWHNKRKKKLHHAQSCMQLNSI